MADETARLVVEWMTKKVGLIAKWMLQVTIIIIIIMRT